MISSSPKARQMLSTLLDLPPVERASFSRSLGDLSVFEDALLENGCPTSEVESLMAELDHGVGLIRSQSQQLMALLKSALDRPAETSEIADMTKTSVGAKPRFPTAVGALDELTDGGYGLTTVAGDAKAGKSTFAIATAVRAARAGWLVVYVNAELDKHEIVDAVYRAGGFKIDEAVKLNLTLVCPDTGFSPNDAVRRVSEAVRIESSRILIVLDSINALVDLAENSDSDFWAVNSTWRNFAVRTVRLTQGRVACLVVSETNASGGVKGRSLEFKSDLVVRISKDPDSADEVEIDVTHSRSTRAGKLGRYVRQWQTGSFRGAGN